MSVQVEHKTPFATDELPAQATRSIRTVWNAITGFTFNVAAVSLVAGCFVLTAGVIIRYVTGQSLIWQDEVSIFLIAGAVYLGAASVQAARGHIGIELFGRHASPNAVWLRGLVVDALVLTFCMIFAWKAGTMLREAWLEGQTSHSVWAPPLWIPYGILTFGMTLLALQVVFQVAERSLLAVLLVVVAVVAYLAWDRPSAALVTGLPQWSVGVLYALATFAAMFSGMPIAFSLGLVSVTFMILFMPAASLDTMTLNFYEELGNLIILAIPPFILQGAAIGRSDAGRDVYAAMHAWLNKIPGGLGVANIMACGLFAAMSGSSPATASAIGSAGIPEMRRRGYSGGFAAGIIAAGGTLGILIPPSVTMLLYAVAAEVSLGKLFLAGFGPGVMLIVLFSIYSMIRFRKEKRMAQEHADRTGEHSAILTEHNYTLNEKLRMISWVMPFVIIMTGVMIVLYKGIASPSETAGVAGVLALAVVGIMYRVWRPSKVMPILGATLRESTMLLMIVGMSLLYANVMSYLHISQDAAAWVIALGLSKWVLLGAVVVFVIVLGFFLPPVSIILMTAPIILPPLRAAGFDLIWFGVIMTIVMEMGLIHPPVGLNIFVIKSIAPDIRLSDIIWGTLPFLFLMFLGILLLSVFPEIAMWLPEIAMK